MFWNSTTVIKPVAYYHRKAIIKVLYSSFIDGTSSHCSREILSLFWNILSLYPNVSAYNLVFFNQTKNCILNIWNFDNWCNIQLYSKNLTDSLFLYIELTIQYCFYLSALKFFWFTRGRYIVTNSFSQCLRSLINSDIDRY